VLRTTQRTVASVPDVVEAILVLPSIADQLEVIRVQTATLPEMYEEIARVRGDTSALRRLEANTAAVERLAEVIVPLEGTILRFSRFGGRVPQRRP
jgi:hypothetical protein